MSLFVRVVSRTWIRALVSLCLSLFSLRVFAQPQAPPPPANFFTDPTGVVPADIAAQIEQRLRDLQKASSNQVLVVVADRLPEGYTSVEEYTNRTAEAWRVGDKSRDNGAVIFVFVGDRKVRIEVGYGLEGALPDALASRIINDEITPRFREGKYGEGLLAAVDAIVAVTKGEYQPQSQRRTGSRTNTIITVLTILFFLFFGVIIPIWREIDSIRNPRTYSGRGRSRGWGGGGGWGSSGGLFSGGGGGSSWGSGGGGFSGGGGSFGGGGASGSW